VFNICVNAVAGLLLVFFTWTDLKCRRIWWPAAAGAGVFALAARAAFGKPLTDGLWGILAGLLLLAVSHFCGEAIGKGDCYAVAGCGALLGFAAVFEMMFTAVLFAAAWSVLLLVRNRDLKQRFAFMPFLLAAWLCRILG
jgi:prepilin signal peptidase PulO-like enzyme (type II secretory pathway)